MLGLPNDISRELSNLLEYDEKPVDFRKEPWSFYKRNRWVVLTSKRVYLIKKIYFGISFDITQVILAMAHFEMVEGILFDTLYIRIPVEGEHIINFFHTQRGSTLKFLAEMEKARDQQVAALEGRREEGQKIIARAELEALAKTFYENKITSKEYEAKKKRLIDKL